MTYLVQCHFRDGLFWAERDVGDTDRATTIDHIRSGNLWNVVAVLELNPVEGICRDVTADILAEVEQQRREREDHPPSLAELKQTMIDMLREHERELRVFGW